jgi:hypothetical protein
MDCVRGPHVAHHASQRRERADRHGARELTSLGDPHVSAQVDAAFDSPIDVHVGFSADAALERQTFTDISL